MQYLELRYNSRILRLMASFSYAASIILYMGVVLYAPCLALHTITGLSVVTLIMVGGVVVTIYTVLVRKSMLSFNYMHLTFCLAPFSILSNS